MRRIRLFLLPLLLGGTIPIAAQVGHDPGTSPFRDIRTGTAWEIYGGSIKGSGGPIPVGPRDGPYLGVRALLRAKNTVSIGFGVWNAFTERTVLDPTVTPSAREVGVRDAHLLAGEVTLQFQSEAVPTEIQLADSSGRVFLKRQLKDFDGYFNEQLSLREATPGTITLTIRQGDKLATRQLVLLNRA